MSARQFKNVPPRFLRECSECDIDIGSYEGKVWSPTDEQYEDVVDRAEHYAGDSVDAAPAGLKTAARAFLKAVQS